MSTKGLSIIICCYNSAIKIPITLEYLSKQHLPENFPIELIIIDNKCTDNTILVSKETWANLKTVFPLRIIYEARAGNGYARRCGLDNAKYEYVLFVDDDNYLEPNYIKKVIQILNTKPEVAACGGLAVLPYSNNYNIPFWWNDFKHAFAIGPQGKKEGYVGYLVTAGMGLRKSVYDKIKELSYDFILSGRKGTQILTGGEDAELCYAFRLLGYKIYYSPELKYQHAIGDTRLNEAYLIKMYEGNGLIVSYLHAYTSILKYGFYNWTLNLIQCYFLFIYFSINYLIGNLLKNKRKIFKHRIKLIIISQQLKQSLSMNQQKFNIICSNIKKLKKN